jgi:Ion channel
MDILAPVCGAVLVAAAALDVFRTVLLPSSRGGSSDVIAGVLWAVVARSPVAVRRRLLPGVGPAGLVLAVVLWMGLLLVGFALCYLPFVEDLAYAPGPRRPVGWAEALYLSGTALTTLGFGDVVAQDTPLRLLTVAQAACGLAVLTATLGYLPALYTVVSALRGTNQAVADLGADTARGAAELLAVQGSTTVDRVRRDVIAARQHLLRFPVLHWFAPPDDESVVALGRGAVSLWVAGHFAHDEGQPLHRHVKGLEQALRRLTDDLSAHGVLALPPRSRAQAAEEFRRAQALSQRQVPDAAGEVADTSLDLLVRLRQVIDGYAARHGRRPEQAPAGQAGD